MQEKVLKESFVKDLQEDVDQKWRNPGSAEKIYSLPKKVDRICFTNNEFNNLRIISGDITEEKNIEHIDIAKIIEERDPYCILNVEREVKLVISRVSKEDLVTITRQWKLKIIFKQLNTHKTRSHGNVFKYNEK